MARPQVSGAPLQGDEDLRQARQPEATFHLPVNTFSQCLAARATTCPSPFPAPPHGAPRPSPASPADSPPAKRRRLCSPRRTSIDGSRAIDMPDRNTMLSPVGYVPAGTTAVVASNLTAGSCLRDYALLRPKSSYDNATATSTGDLPSSASSGEHTSPSTVPSTPVAAPGAAAAALPTARTAAPLQPSTTCPTNLASLTGDSDSEHLATYTILTTTPVLDDVDEKEENVFVHPAAATPVGIPLAPPSPASSFSSVSSLCSLPSLTGFTMYAPAQRQRRELLVKVEGVERVEQQGAPAAVDAAAAAAVARVLFVEGQEGTGMGEASSPLLQLPHVVLLPPPQQQQEQQQQRLFVCGQEGTGRQAEELRPQQGELQQDELQGMVECLGECLRHSQEGEQEQQQEGQLQGHEVQGIVEWLEECLRVDVESGVRSTGQQVAAGGGGGGRRVVAAATAAAAAGRVTPLRGRRTNDRFAHSNLENDNDSASYFVEEEVVSVDLEDDTEEVAIEPIPVAQGLAAWRQAQEARQHAGLGSGVAGGNPLGQQQGPGAKALLQDAGHSPAAPAPCVPVRGLLAGRSDAAAHALAGKEPRAPQHHWAVPDMQQCIGRTADRQQCISVHR